MEWEQLGERKDGKSRECNLRWDGNSQNENNLQYVVTVYGGNKNRRWEGVGTSRSGAKCSRDSRSRPDPLPTRPHFPDAIIIARTLDK